MKYILSGMIFFLVEIGFAQTRLPVVDVEDLRGGTVSTGRILDEGLPVILTFWSTVCRPCLQELDAFAEQWEEQQPRPRFKVVAVSTDDTRSSAKVQALVKSNEWPFTILLDKNQNFKRALNVNAIPHLYVVDAKGYVVYSRIGYTPGSELKVMEILKGL